MSNIEQLQLRLSSQEGETGLICAAQRGNAEIVQILIDNKANLDLQDKVQNKISSNHDKIAFFFLSLQRGLSALHHACRRQQIPIATTLINAGCNINIIDSVSRKNEVTFCKQKISYRTMKHRCTMLAKKVFYQLWKHQLHLVVDWIYEINRKQLHYIQLLDMAIRKLLDFFVWLV